MGELELENFIIIVLYRIALGAGAWALISSLAVNISGPRWDAVVCENDFKIGAELCKCKDNQKAMGVDDNGGKQSKIG